MTDEQPQDPQAAARRDQRFHGEAARQAPALWRIATGPIIWGAHFLVCYWIGAVWCAHAGPGAPLDPVRWGVAGATVAALLALGLAVRSIGRRRGLSVEGENLVFNSDTAEERSRFLAHVATLLCLVSFAAVVFTALPALLLETCR